MKKVLLFAPGIAFAIFYGLAALDGIGAVHPLAVVWLMLLWVAGILLEKSILWGGLVGMLPGIYFMYLGTQETGQVISETPVGIALVLYYGICTYYCHKKNLSQKQK